MAASASPSSSSATSSPFLRLPAEVRLLIYRYLIPDNPLETWSPRLDPFYLRLDGKPCASAILRTNRTVYQEVVREWYGLIPYVAVIKQQCINFLGTIIPPSLVLSIFWQIRSFELIICLESEPSEINANDSDLTWMHMPGLKDCIKVLADCLSPAQGGRLEYLCLHLTISSHFCASIRERPDDFCKALE